MNLCPYIDGDAINEASPCGLSSTEGSQSIAYCKRCSQIAFQCTEGHWSRAYARYCTQCNAELEKPAQWRMASGNPQRTAVLPVDTLTHDGFRSFMIHTPHIESGENLPGLLAIDGLIVVPNPPEQKLDAYAIVDDSEGRHLSLRWSAELNSELTYGSTPVYHGLHLYSVVSGGIQKISVIDGKTEFIDINRIDTPLPQCAPLKCDVNGRPTMIIGVDGGLFLFDFTIDSELSYIERDFFYAANVPTSPVLCGTYIVLTSKQGGIFSLNISEPRFRIRNIPRRNRWFSAPVSLNGLVYFEALSDTGNRSLARFEPISGQVLSNAADLDSEQTQHFDTRPARFTQPPLTDGRQLYLSDISGRTTVYAYDSEDGFLREKSLPHGSDHRFVPHQSLFLNGRIYSAHAGGLTTLKLDGNISVQTPSLSMGSPTGPSPIARPIRYVDSMFILCKDRLICRDYQEV